MTRNPEHLRRAAVRIRSPRPTSCKQRQPLPYHTRGTLLTRGEAAFYAALVKAVAGDAIIAMKVRAADLISCSVDAWEKGFGDMVAKHHLDFVLCCRRTTHIIVAIELDDRSHERSDRKRRDKFLSQAFFDAGIPLIRVKAASQYDCVAIRAMLASLLAAYKRPAPANGTPTKKTVSEAGPLQSKEQILVIDWLREA